VGEDVEELVGTGEDFSIVVTEIEKGRLEGRTSAMRKVVETHLRICHCKSYLESLRMSSSCPHCKYLCPLIQKVCKLGRG
jgi:thiol-disulfide isomerase/thioredoxin